MANKYPLGISLWSDTPLRAGCSMEGVIPEWYEKG
jgi:hypothetical protein